MKINLAIALISIATIAGCSSTPRDPSQPTGRVIGEIVQVIKAPDRCEEKDNSLVRGLIGAGLGVALGNQVGGGSGKKWAQVGLAGVGYSIGKNTNKEDDDLTVCKDRGYLITVVYEDNFGQMKYHEKRFNKPRKVGELIDFKF